MNAISQLKLDIQLTKDKISSKQKSLKDLERINKQLARDSALAQVAEQYYRQQIVQANAQQDKFKE